MNKKGFTLVELLAVIVVLGLVITITATKGFGAFDNTKKAITKQNLKAIKEAANVLATQIDNCDDDVDSELWTTKSLNMGNNCSELKTQMSKEKGCIETSVDYLISKDYLSDNDDFKDIKDKKVKICKENNKIVIDTSEIENIENDVATTTTTTTTTATTTTAHVDPCKNIEFDKSTLAYKLICDAKSNTYSTSSATYRDKPVTSPGAEVSQRYLNQVSISDKITTNLIYNYKNYYVTYGTKYTINEKTGKFTITDKKICKYSDNCINDAIKKYGYVYTNSYYGSSSNVMSDDSNKLYKLIRQDIPVDNNSYTIEFYSLSSSPYNYESTLSKTEDNYGESYYYRGGVTNNYINFAGMCFRIVRIQGNGSIKLILEDKNTTCENATGEYSIGEYSYGVDKSNKNNYENYYRKMIFINNNSTTDTIDKGFENFQTTKLNNVLNKLDYGSWCFDNSGYSDSKGTNKLTSFIDSYKEGTNIYYGANTRIATKKPSLKCNVSFNTKYYNRKNMYVGTLTADEVIYAGAKYQEDNTTYYLNNGKSYTWWTLSPHMFTDKKDGEDHIYHVLSNSNINCIACAVGYNSYVRPAIILKANTSYLSGDGTKTNPFNIN